MASYGKLWWNSLPWVNILNDKSKSLVFHMKTVRLPG